MKAEAEEQAHDRREKAKDSMDMAKDCMQLVEVMVGITPVYFASRGGGGSSKKSRIGLKGEEDMVVIDLSSHSSKPDNSIRSERETEGCGGENMGGVPNIISRGASPD